MIRFHRSGSTALHPRRHPLQGTRGRDRWRIAAVLASLVLVAAQTPGTAEDIDVFRPAALGKLPRDWSVSTHGWKAETTAEHAEAGAKPVKLWLAGPSDAPFGNLLRSIDGEPLRSRHVVLDARLLVEGEGQAQMWMRVDRAEGARGAFDNMDDRPIVAGGWKPAHIEFDVEDDAETIYLGFMSIGGATVYVDSVTMKAIGPAREVQPPSPPAELTDRGLDNLDAAARVLSYVRFFHPSDAAVAQKNWDGFAVRLMEQIEPARDAKELAQRLHDAFERVAPGIELWPGTPDGAPALPPIPAGVEKVAHWEHRGAGVVARRGPNAYSSRVVKDRIKGAIDDRDHRRRFLVEQLPGGVSLRLQREVYRDKDGSLPRASAPPSNGGEGPILKAHNRATRLASITLLWGVMQHFYPYFDVVECDWNAALRRALADAALADGEDAHARVLRTLVAQLHDGHGYVSSPRTRAAMLPIKAIWAGSQVVVIGRDTSVAGDVQVGDVLVSIDGTPIETLYRRCAASISAATEGWRRYVTLHEILAGGDRTGPAVLKLRRLDGSEASVTTEPIPFDRLNIEGERMRLADGTELAPGIVYMNLVGADEDAWQRAQSALTTAKGIVFDMRGYPAEAARIALQHLRGEVSQSARWCVPVITRPDGEDWEWSESGRWSLEPVEPRIEARLAWLTDASAISYAESIMGIVEAYSLGEIVGSTTAGTNGNVNPFDLPGGYSVSWTGMRVLKHDGSRHHGVGIAPTIPCVPTAAGIAAGKDEVLERAVAALREQISR